MIFWRDCASESYVNIILWKFYHYWVIFPALCAKRRIFVYVHLIVKLSDNFPVIFVY